MIKVSAYQNDEGIIRGFCMSGHAEYADPGEDIVCAAVSALVINTVNSVETFTDDVFSFEAEEKSGRMEFIITSDISDKSILLMNSLFLGLQGIQDNYGQEYISIVSE